uniref:Basal body-orientation factor 1 n=1 Tax=Trypanosoma congolense (strain IL3000) TaxID=1068625 RepID=G0UX65_TRYCI|nr:conserved hypothetical protein [Trypanosoma congolense IL3000]
MMPSLEQKNRMSTSSQRSPRQDMTSSLQLHEAPLDSQEVKVALVSATLANAQLRASQAFSAQRAMEVVELQSIRDDLEREISVRDEEDVASAKYFQLKLAIATKENGELKRKLEMTHASIEQRVQEAVRQVQGSLQERDEHITSLKKRLAEVEEELKSVIDFRDARDVYQEQMRELRRIYLEECEQRKEEVREARLSCMEERVRLKAEEREHLIQRDAEIERLARSYFTTKTHATEHQNKKLKQELYTLLENKKMIQGVAEELQKANRKLKRDVEMASTVEAEHTTRNAKQKKEIELLKEQVKTTDENMDTMAVEYERRLQKQEKSHNAAMKLLTAECETLRSTVEALRADLLKMRRISEKLVGERTEMETFFHEALEQVRRETLEEQRKNMQSIGHHHSKKGARLELQFSSQPRQPLLISDRGIFASPSHLTPKACAKSGLPGTEKGMVSLSSKSVCASLPLITMSSTFYSPYRNAVVPPIEWRDTSHERKVAGTTGVADCRTLGESGFSHVLTASELKDLRPVEISQLSWSEKERVLQLLFKRLKGGPMARKQSKQVSADDTNFLSNNESVVPEMGVFLTE